MERHIRRKTKRKDDKYVLDYRKCKDENKARYSILEAMNRQDDIFVLINSSLALVDHHENQEKPFENRKEQQEVIAYLEEEGFRVAWKTPKYEEKGMLFGVPMGKTEIKTRFILGVLIPKGELNNGLFGHLLSGCDYMAGIGCLSDYEAVYSGIEAGEIMTIDDGSCFEYTSIDSPFMQQCYTNYPWERLED